MEIRAAAISDAAGIAGLINREIRTGLAIWRYAERPESEIAALLSDRITAGQAVYVAAADGLIAGWAGYGPFRSGEGYRHTMEHSVHIAPAYQRRGLATRLMQQLVAHADKADVHSLIGAVEASNSASLALHKKLGFSEVGRLPEIGRKFDQWLDLVLVQRIGLTR